MFLMKHPFFVVTINTDFSMQDCANKQDCSLFLTFVIVLVV